jgi:hypothetical protein
MDLARTLSAALTAHGVPNPTPPDEATGCNAKVPCLIDLAQKRGIAVLVTLEAGSALDEVVLHLEALSVEELGQRASTFDYTGPPGDFGGDLLAKLDAFFTPAVRGVLGVGTPVAAAAEPRLTEPNPATAQPTEPKPTEPKPATAQPTQSTAPAPSDSVELEQAASPAAARSALKYAGIAGMGVGAALLVTSAVLGGLTLSSAGQLHADCPMNPCTNPDAYSAYASAGNTQNAGIALLVTGAAVAAAGALLFFVDLGGGSAGIAPSVRGDGMSLLLFSRF